MEQKPTTIKEIAKKLNISFSTVSRALHDHPNIGLRTKMRVQQLAKELNYEPNQTAIFFQQRKTFTIGVTDVTFNPVNAIFGRMLHTPDGHVVTQAYWQVKAVHCTNQWNILNCQVHYPCWYNSFFTVPGVAYDFGTWCNLHL